MTSTLKSAAAGMGLLLAASSCTAADFFPKNGDRDGSLPAEFEAPPFRFQSRPLWFWNGKLDAEKTRGMVEACRTAGYHGMGILPCNGMGVDFMSREFLGQYKVAVDEAARQGMKMSRAARLS